ncbi:chitinase domain-containing protein 1 [Eupeodes corollae]|uniref:chitinase domain-containing protein 1 n=1 Tax=Eupeodes corollae TaxID=290404 RepID=UPI00249333DC|nr:chitinase domain-containing protein 1 [Eupeodes corollae]
MEFPLQSIIAIILIATLFVDHSIATISPGGGRSKANKQFKVKQGPQEDNVFDRNLVDEEPAARDIIIENAGYHKETSIRRFNGTVLGYVTAWNSHGYDVAKIFAKKFDIISPVWFQIVKTSNGYELAGKHDIDAGWIKDVRKAGRSGKKNLKFYPRVIFDKFTEKDYSKLLSSAIERRLVNEVIVNTCIVHQFDGIVLEIWSQLAARVDDQYLYNLVIELSKEFQQAGLKLILVIPPMREEMHNLFGERHFERLYPHVTAFSLMTYDFSNVQRPGANAPLHWIKTSIENIVPSTAEHFQIKRKKILMGLNMYGNDYTPDGGGPIVAGQFLDLVKNVKKRLTYDEHDVENFFEIKITDGRHIVFYPTLFSINERIKLAQEMGVGISIWELGQGLDYFYDLF